MAACCHTLTLCPIYTELLELSVCVRVCARDARAGAPPGCVYLNDDEERDVQTLIMAAA